MIEYTPIYTYWYKIQQYLLQVLTNAIQPLNKTTGHMQTAENCRMLLTGFSARLTNIYQNIATKFAFNLALSLALGNFACVRSTHKSVYILQSYSIGCSIANCNAKDYVAQILLIARNALTGY